MGRIIGRTDGKTCASTRAKWGGGRAATVGGGGRCGDRLSRPSPQTPKLKAKEVCYRLKQTARYLRIFECGHRPRVDAPAPSTPPRTCASACLSAAERCSAFGLLSAACATSSSATDPSSVTMDRTEPQPSHLGARGGNGGEGAGAGVASRERLSSSDGASWRWKRGARSE